LETYGDTILKLASTLITYWLKKEDPSTGEGDIEQVQNLFVTNFHLFRVGYHHLRMHRYMRIMRDPEAREWTLPLQKIQITKKKCAPGLGTELPIEEE